MNLLGVPGGAVEGGGSVAGDEVCRVEQGPGVPGHRPLLIPGETQLYPYERQWGDVVVEVVRRLSAPAREGELMALGGIPFLCASADFRQ